MSNKKSQVVWAVVLVESGIPVMAEAYRDENTARLREQSLRNGIRPDYDEIGVFEVEIGTQSKDY
jgi:hypothetical protein